jgi:hypothetical protein
MSEGWVSTPSSANIRSSVGYVRSLCTMKPVSMFTVPPSALGTVCVSACPPSRSSASKTVTCALFEIT